MAFRLGGWEHRADALPVAGICRYTDLGDTFALGGISPFRRLNNLLEMTPSGSLPICCR
jgi:hypothetical protein